MAKKIITALSAGLALATVTACGRGATEGPTENPPPPVVEPTSNPPPPEPEPPTSNPPPPDRAPKVEPVLPTWEQVVNPSSEGAAPQMERTNPPTPALRVDPSGDCFVTWHDPRRAEPDAVRAVGPGESPGTQIQCTAEAKALLDAWKTAQGAPSE